MPRIIQAGFLLLILLGVALCLPSWQQWSPLGAMIRLDPLLWIGQWLSTKTVPAGLLQAGTVVLITLILGRFFCSHVCPVMGAAAIRVSPAGSLRLLDGSYEVKGKRLNLSITRGQNRPMPSSSLDFSGSGSSGFPPGFVQGNDLPLCRIFKSECACLTESKTSDLETNICCLASITPVSPWPGFLLGAGGFRYWMHLQEPSVRSRGLSESG